MEPNTSESSIPASVEAPSATPAPAAESTPAADAIQPAGTDPGQPAQELTQSGETLVGSQDEFPDDAAFQALPGEARASNWAKARTRITELNDRVRELDGQAAQYAELGDLEQLQTDAELARSLFSFAQDEEGNTVYDPQTGLPVHSTTEFVSRLQEGSPAIANQLFLNLWGAKGTDGLTGAQRMFQSLGLNPQLLEVYRSIQSPQDAMRYAPQAVDPAELTGVPQELHEAYKSFSAEDRYDLQQLAERDDQRFLDRLNERKESLDNRKFIAEQRQRDEQLRQERAEAGKRQIEEAGNRAMSEADQRVRNAQLAKLKQTAVFFADEADNADVWDDILSRSAQDVLANETLKPKLAEWQAWHRQLAGYEATNDRLLASKARVEIGKLERKLEKEFADRVTVRTGQWSRRLGGARAVHQQQIQDAQPRIEITSGGDTSGGVPAPAYSPPPPGQRFGMSEERKQQLAAELRARRQATGV